MTKNDYLWVGCRFKELLAELHVFYEISQEFGQMMINVYRCPRKL